MKYSRRKTTVARVGNVEIGGGNPIRLQSMLNVSTNDTEACVSQALSIVEAGGEVVRLTTQGTKEAGNLGMVKKRLRELGCDVPLVADVHFNAEAAEAAALTADKVRINPGNYAKTAEEAERKFRHLLATCREHGTAIRIGVNHGSMSPRMVERYGDTPEGLAQSCLEFLRICRDEHFDDVVISVKASNVRVMVQTVRLLCRRMDEEDMHYPLHLGVTEAGDGESGRVKSAAGIGSLLADGMGDTIRVSLSEDPAAEIPVAKRIAEFIDGMAAAPEIEGSCNGLFDPVSYVRRTARQIGDFGGSQPPVVLAADEALPEGVKELELESRNAIAEARIFFARLKAEGDDSPVVLTRRYETADPERLQIEAAIEFGSLFLDGLGDGMRIVAPNINPKFCEALAYEILQATRSRMSKTEYISCPGCGRTLFDLQGTLARIKAETSHLKHLKIGVMGCIVNGPGEMADADYGYVGAGPGRVSLYKGKECLEKNIPSEQAVERLADLIKREGDWREP